LLILQVEEEKRLSGKGVGKARIAVHLVHGSCRRDYARRDAAHARSGCGSFWLGEVNR
jgi:hypothetical protein